MTFEEIKNLIEKSSKIIDFAPFGEGVSDEWIEKAQERLNVKFPNSYKWWLKNYGGGEIKGQEIFSVYEVDFDQVVGGDIVCINELNRSNGSNLDKLTIMETDFGEVYYLNLSSMNENDECPVFEEMSNQKVADNFIEFLKMKIIE